MRRRLAVTLLALGLAAPGFSAAGPGASVLDPGLAARIRANPEAVVDALVTVAPPARPADVLDVNAVGVGVYRVFDEFGVLYVAGRGRDLARLEGLPRVRAVVPNGHVRWESNTGTIATRAREAWDAKSTSTTPVLGPGGAVVNGSGVGVALVDTGVDGTHPDLAPALAANKRWICPAGLFVREASSPFLKCYERFLVQFALNGFNPDLTCNDAAWTDIAITDEIGHGTHVAGIVAGRGSASDGRFTGSAPGATLYGLGSAEGDSFLWVLEAFQWVTCNHNLVSPAIRVVTNSWGRTGQHQANDPITQAVNALVSKGIVVLFAAGNSGGNGNADEVDADAQNPTPGVIGVASYNDDEKATREGNISDFSSRGKLSDPVKSNWPDLAAPGEFIASTLSKGPAIGLFPEPSYLPYYASADGTSMSTPHAAGVVALLLQADPSLTPADVEDILEDTAHQLTSAGSYVPDPDNPGSGGINFAAGHGLVDAVAALGDPRVGASGGSALPQLSQDPRVYVEGLLDPQPVGGGVQWTVKAGRAVSLAERTLASGNPTTYPLAEGQAANFRVTGPISFDAPTTLEPDTTAGTVAMYGELPAGFPAPGAYAVEAQVDFGSGLVSFDSFVVRAI